MLPLPPRINDSARRTCSRPADKRKTAPLLPGAVYRRLDLVTGLYEYGVVQSAREQADGSLLGTITRQNYQSDRVVENTNSFADWELYGVPTYLEEPMAAELTDQHKERITRALSIRAKWLASLPKASPEQDTLDAPDEPR